MQGFYLSIVVVFEDFFPGRAIMVERKGSGPGSVCYDGSHDEEVKPRTLEVFYAKMWCPANSFAGVN